MSLIRTRASISFLALALALALAPLGVGCSKEKGEGTPEAIGQTVENKDADTKILVRVGKFRVDEISMQLSLPADLEAVEEADFYPEVTGVIDLIEKREGETVKKGEAIVLLVDQELRLTKEMKDLALEDKQTAARLAEIAVQEADAAVVQKAFLVEQADREHQRFVKLAGEDGLVSPEEFETKLYAKREAEGNLQAAKLVVERRRVEKEQAASAVKLAAKELETAAFNLSRTILRSPIDGVITFLDHKKGELVSPSTKVFSVVRLDRLESRMQVPQRELRRLREGLVVDIECGVFPGRVFPGKVRVINPVIDKDGGTVAVLVDVEATPKPRTPEEGGKPTDPEEVPPRLLPGMFVDGRIVTATHENAVLVDKRAVLYDAGQPILFLVRDGKAYRCEIEPGFSVRTHLEILGLTTTGTDESGVETRQEIGLSKRQASGGEEFELEFGRLVLVGQNKLNPATLVQIEGAKDSAETSEPEEPESDEPEEPESDLPVPDEGRSE